MRGQGFKNPPVQVGEEFDVKIEAVGEKGDGIAKKDGFVLFVPAVKEGDEVRIKVTKVLRNVGFAEVAGSAQSTPESDAQQEDYDSEESAEEKPAEEPAPESSEDSEDFGEEIEEQKD